MLKFRSILRGSKLEGSAIDHPPLGLGLVTSCKAALNLSPPEKNKVAKSDIETFMLMSLACRFPTTYDLRPKT